MNHKNNNPKNKNRYSIDSEANFRVGGGPHRDYSREYKGENNSSPKIITKMNFIMKIVQIKEIQMIQ